MSGAPNGVPRVYVDEPCPLPGYEGAVTARILSNPTRREIDDYEAGRNLTLTDLDDIEREAAAALQQTDLPDDVRANWQNLRDVVLPAARERWQRFGRALHAFYRECRINGLDFSTPEAALASITSQDYPEEVLYWLRELPGALVEDRRDLIKKARTGFSAAATK